MKKYTRPNAEIVAFDVEDIITASGEVLDAFTFTGENKEMHEIYKENSTVGNRQVSVFTW